MIRISLTQADTATSLVLVVEHIETYHKNGATGDSSVHMVSGTVWEVAQSVAEIGDAITVAGQFAIRARR